MERGEGGRRRAGGRRSGLGMWSFMFSQVAPVSALSNEIQLTLMSVVNQRNHEFPSGVNEETHNQLQEKSEASLPSRRLCKKKLFQKEMTFKREREHATMFELKKITATDGHTRELVSFGDGKWRIVCAVSVQVPALLEFGERKES